MRLIGSVTDAVFGCIDTVDPHVVEHRRRIAIRSPKTHDVRTHISFKMITCSSVLAPFTQVHYNLCIYSEQGTEQTSPHTIWVPPASTPHIFSFFYKSFSTSLKQQHSAPLSVFTEECLRRCTSCLRWKRRVIWTKDKNNNYFVLTFNKSSFLRSLPPSTPPSAYRGGSCRTLTKEILAWK